jgi:hypothetical protein
MDTKFNLTINVFTEDVHDACDVAEALRKVADRLAKFTSSPWSPYALQGEIYAPRNPIGAKKRVIGTWSLDSEVEKGLQLTITAENDPDSRVHCESCGEHVRSREKRCEACSAELHS